MSNFAPLQHKSARTTSPMRQRSAVFQTSREVEPQKAPSISDPERSTDQPHPLHYSLANIPIDAPDQTPHNRSEEHRKNNTGLPDKLKAGIENLSGLSMDDVKVHYGSLKPDEIEALAYTQGMDIHVGPGQEKHLPHEAWHVVQQKQGRVVPTMRVKGRATNDDEELEEEAELIGKRISRLGASILGGTSIREPGNRFEQDVEANTDHTLSGSTTFVINQGSSDFKSKPEANSRLHKRASDGLNSQVVQRLKGAIPKKAKGLSRKEIRELIKESETTKFDMRGHTKSKHGADVTDEQLMNRLHPEEGKKINLATSFSSNELLIQTIEKAVADNIGKINAWLASKSEDHLVLEVDMSKELKEGESLGEGLQRIGGIGPSANKVANLTKATVIFRKVLPDRITKSMDLAKETEWHLLTAFPSE